MFAHFAVLVLYWQIESKKYAAHFRFVTPAGTKRCAQLNVFSGLCSGLRTERPPAHSEEALSSECLQCFGESLFGFLWLKTLTLLPSYFWIRSSDLETPTLLSESHTFWSTSAGQFVFGDQLHSVGQTNKENLVFYSFTFAQLCRFIAAVGSLTNNAGYGSHCRELEWFNLLSLSLSLVSNFDR